MNDSTRTNTTHDNAAKQEEPGKGEEGRKNAVLDADGEARREAARLMGRSRSSQKQAAARSNGQRGGRPPGQKADEATRQRMKESQRQRRQSEKEKATENP